VAYLIYGAGAVGGAIGGQLFRHGHDVTLVARGANYQALRDRGLTLATPEATVELDIPVVDRIDAAGVTAGDVVILTMKSQDTVPALEALAATADSSVAVVCAQNGVANERHALRHFAHVYGLCVMLPATYLEAGRVEAGWAPVTGILDAGRYPDGVDATAERLSADLAASTFLSRPEMSIMRLKYRKLLMNLANAIDAACGPHGRAGELARRARAEGVACLEAAGIAFASEEEDLARRRDLPGGWPPPGGQSRGSSSWQSLARQTGSIEADYLNGEIVLLGRLHGVATPVNEMLQRVANRMAREKLLPGSFTTDELMAELA
jgi:2-dehydropantoate 2-reductase